MHNLRALTVGLFLLLQLLGCGNVSTSQLASSDGGISGTGISDGGISGTGIVAGGPIYAFGSIYVNSIRFDTDNAEVLINNEPASADDLVLGMYVRVNGSVNDDGVTGVATQVAYFDNLAGPASDVSFTSNGEYKVMTVLGQSVLINAEDTVLNGKTFEALTTDDWITVSGRNLNESSYIADRIEINSAPEANEPVRFTATITAINGNTLTFNNGVDVDISGVTGVTANNLSVGQKAEILGVLDNNSVTATTLNTEIGYAAQTINFQPQQALTIQGPITYPQSSLRATVSGVDMNIENAQRIPAFFTFQEGLQVRISGQYDEAEVVAETIRVLSMLEEGTVTAIDSSAQLISIRLERFDEVLDFKVNTATVYLENSSSGTGLDFSGINVGDTLKIKVLLDANNQYVGTQLNRIESFTGVNSVDPGVSGENSTLTIQDQYNASSPILIQDVVLASGGVLSLTLDSRNATEYGRINANGTVSLAGTLTIVNDGLTFQNGDTFNLLDGSISGAFTAFILPALNAGLTWDLTNLYTTGEVSVVSQPVIINSALRLGDYTLSSTDTLSVELNDTPLSANYGRISSVGTVTLAGSLVITESITEVAGSTFDILDWGTLATGSQFEDIQLPALSPGLVWDLDNLYVDGSISIIQAPGGIASSPRLWLDAADAGSVVRNGSNNVSFWIDKSGYNNSNIQSILANRPEYSPSQSFMNNLPSIEFDDVDDELSVEGSIIVGTDYTILVVEARGNGSVNWFLGGDQSGIDDQNGHFGYFNDNVIRMSHWGTRLDQTSVSSFSTQTSQLTTFRHSSTEGKTIFVNGLQVAQDATLVSPLIDNGEWTVGKKFGNEYYGGNIAEIIVFDSALSVSERNAVELYLTNKYGLP